MRTRGGRPSRRGLSNASGENERGAAHALDAAARRHVLLDGLLVRRELGDTRPRPEYAPSVFSRKTTKSTSAARARLSGTTES